MIFHEPALAATALSPPMQQQHRIVNHMERDFFLYSSIAVQSEPAGIILWKSCEFFIFFCSSQM